MKENYIISAFRETVKRDFAGRAQVLNEAFDGRLQLLRQENADASKEKQRPSREADFARHRGV